MSGTQDGSVKSKTAFFDAWVKSNMKVDPPVVRHRTQTAKAAQPPVDTNPPPTAASVPPPTIAAVDGGPGLKGLELGKKYVGEEKGEGWRKDQKRNGLQRTTKHFDDAERDASEVRFSDTGDVSAPDGASLNGAHGFVVDPKTGTMHQFDESSTTQGVNDVSVHHSSPLAGGAVAGAGKFKVEDDRIININDQSGHYKPGGEYTFQTVRQINMATLSKEIQGKLKKTASGRAKGGDGAAESPDTLEQLIAAEIGKARDLYFADLDKKEAELKANAAALPEAEQDAAFEKIAQSRRDTVNAFRSDAAKMEAALRTGDALSPLMSNTESEDDDDVDRDDNKETTISLLGKKGALDDAEYQPLFDAYKAVQQNTSSSVAEKAAARDTLQADFNRASALKQLASVLGEEAFGQLLKKKPSGGTSAVEQAMDANSLKPGDAGAVAKLKALLGKQAVDAIKNDDAKIQELSDKYKVASIDVGVEWGAEGSAFEVGKKSTKTVTAQQYLQTGGNEDQIRAKDRLTDEIQPNRSKPGPRPALKPQPASPMHAEISDNDKFQAQRTSLNEELESLEKAQKGLQGNLDYYGNSPTYKALIEEAEAEMKANEQKKGRLLQELKSIPTGDDPNAARKAEIVDLIEEVEGTISHQKGQIEYYSGSEFYKTELEQAETEHAIAEQKLIVLKQELGTL